ncbi:hypothetical protein [Streptomyces sp. WZ-12]|uniref:hypothetical protein n=1 Tax=Streptomyces sp. WZ-12 TaxID=3030210 RepID=UPI002380EB6F|nr:hypothetical protein [Streptomyces sp. WZ-12]
MADLVAPLRALRLLAADFPDLPALDIDINLIYPDQLRLISYDGFGAFEAWREALEVPPDAVTYRGLRELGAGHSSVLEASTDYAGTRLRLVGYGQVEAGKAVA